MQAMMGAHHPQRYYLMIPAILFATVHRTHRVAQFIFLIFFALLNDVDGYLVKLPDRFSYRNSLVIQSYKREAAKT